MNDLMKRKNDREFYFFIENFRAIAILLVVLSHLKFHTNFLNHKEIQFIIGNATTFFVFISGFLFYWTEQNRFSYRNYLWKKVQVVLFPYLFIVIPNIFWGLATHQNEYYGLGGISYFLWSLIVGGSVSGQLWFIPMIVIAFLATPVFIGLVRGNQMVFAFFVVSLVLISVFTGRPILNSNPLLSFVHFSGFYGIGVFCARYYPALTIDAKRLIAIAGAFVFFACLTHIPNSNEAKLFTESFGIFNIQSLSKLGLTLALLFGMALTLNVRVKLLAYFANISFGIFFIHVDVAFFVHKMMAYSRTELDKWSYLVVEVAFTIGFSIIFVELVKKIFGKRSPYVIGC